MKIETKISILNRNNESFMGIGLVWLLQRINQLKSINKAAKSMDMSYSKAHKILKRLEKNLEEKILSKNRGGNERGGAELTPFALKFIKEYNDFQKKIKKLAKKEFRAFASKTIPRLKRSALKDSALLKK
ncbi:MAG: LysR family transcriptional regulator [Elusimicrobia bacterium]|nr:LysR family transcriptional regulator [Elusimicrobiota bacterium]